MIHSKNEIGNSLACMCVELEISKLSSIMSGKQWKNTEKYEISAWGNENNEES
jgi:hypothetical protein